MKKLLMLLGFIGVIHLTTGINSSANLLSPKKESNDMYSAILLSPITPSYTRLKGNLFLAIETEGLIEVVDGDVIEFVFSKHASVRSFHVNEINQDLIDTGKASLFVMVHNDLALALRLHRLVEINILNNKEASTLAVDQFWIPDEHLSNL